MDYESSSVKSNFGGEVRTPEPEVRLPKSSPAGRAHNTASTFSPSTLHLNLCVAIAKTTEAYRRETVTIDLNELSDLMARRPRSPVYQILRKPLGLSSEQAYSAVVELTASGRLQFQDGRHTLSSTAHCHKDGPPLGNLGQPSAGQPADSRSNRTRPVVTQVRPGTPLADRITEQPCRQTSSPQDRHCGTVLK